MVAVKRQTSAISKSSRTISISHYEIVEENLVRGETRLLKVFSLKPRTLGRPSFHARVDDGSAVKLKSPELDIDIDGVNDAIKADFKGNRNGYLGHHNNRSPDPQQKSFEIEIATPAGKVFQGDVFFNVAFSVGLNFTGRSSMSADATVVRASRE